MALNDNEVKALDLFRVRASKLTNVTDDDFLLRWLRARDLDLNKAEEMLKKCLEWRERENVSSTLNFEAAEEVVNSFKWTMSGCDAEGRPIIIVPYGDWEVRKFIEKGLKNDCVLRARRLLEEIRVAIEAKKDEGVTQFVIVLDSSGLTFWKIAHMETVNAVLSLFRDFEAYYPETLHCCYIINAPWVFPYIFNAVKPLLSMRTLGKVQIFDSSSKWRKTLLQELPPSSLPEEYNGTGKSVTLYDEKITIPCSVTC